MGPAPEPPNRWGFLGDSYSRADTESSDTNKVSLLVSPALSPLSPFSPFGPRSPETEEKTGIRNGSKS